MNTVFLKRKFPISCHTEILSTKFSVAIRRQTALYRPFLDERQAFLKCFYSELIHFAEKMSPCGCTYLINGQTYSKISFSLPVVKLKDKYPISRGNSIVLLSYIAQENHTQDLLFLLTRKTTEFIV